MSTLPPDLRARDLVAFWFGPSWDDDVPLPEGDETVARWWRADPAFDALLDARFGWDHLEAARGRWDALARSPELAVARVIALDQLPRNLYRGTAHAFATDRLARRATREALDTGVYDALRPIHRYFMLMPLMHSEALADHDEAVTHFEALAQALAGTARADLYAGGLHFEHRHRDVVARFGRYPHRNAALGRETTPEEAAFLAEHPTGF